MPIISTEIISNYETLVNGLPQIMQSYGINQIKLAEKARIPLSTFKRRMKEKNFSLDEMKRLVEVINQPITFDSPKQ